MPAESVTFLFTDIEGSTKLWERYPDAMKTALARHDAILQHKIEANGGRIFRAVGDAFYAVFVSASDALTAALSAQRALNAEQWGEVESVRVRMALHTDTVEERDGDYFGPTINRILSFMYAGHGGQILLSWAAQNQIRDSLPPGAQLRDLGNRRLKDLTSLEHIFQLVTPDLPADFLPLRTLDARPTNLPAQPTALIGRELEAAAACAFLRREDVRLLTLIGPGGVGKSRLGLQVAADLLEEFEDGVFVVYFGMVCDAGLVSFTIAETLQVRQATGNSLLEGLHTYLCEKQALLVFDNFEHLLPAAPLIAELLARSPQLKILVTSRAELCLQGEHTFPVPPLSLPKLDRLPPLNVLSQYAAVALFVERTRAVRPDFALTEENAMTVLKICARLDRLPLAIELAAARSKLLSPQAMLRRLNHRLPLLTGGARDLPARQQTMRGAIAWSYDLLDAHERALFRRLAVFCGGCTLASASEIVETADGALPVGHSNLKDRLDSLVHKSMLRCEEKADRRPRFTMLETIREYALERLADSGEEEGVRQRHAGFFMRWAEKAELMLTSADRLEWLARLDAEHDNLRAALEWGQVNHADSEICLRLAGALWWFWNLRGYWSEGREWLERALALPGASQHTIWRAKALYGAGELARLQGDRMAARRLLEESLEIWLVHGDKRGVAYAQTALGAMCVDQSDRETARPLLEESVAIFKAVGDKWGLAYALRWLGTATELSDSARARELFEESLWLFREIEDRWGVAMPLASLGFWAYRQKDYATARSLYEECLAIFNEAGDKWLIADALNVLGEIARCQGNYQQAATFYEKGMAFYKELGSKRGMTVALHNLGYVAQYLGDYERAEALFTESLVMRQELGHQESYVFCLVGLAAGIVMKGMTESVPRVDYLERAVRLLGAAELQFETFGIVLDPADRSEYDRYLDAARSQLDKGRFAAAWSEGQAMTLEQAVAYALEAKSM